MYVNDPLESLDLWQRTEDKKKRRHFTGKQLKQMTQILCEDLKMSIWKGILLTDVCAWTDPCCFYAVSKSHEKGVFVRLPIVSKLILCFESSR